MRKVILTHIELKNFKGVESMVIPFQNTSTTIQGRNATGKSTIIDAYLWCLTGKNAEDKEKFGLKTKNSQGDYIERLPHWVEITIVVDNTQYKFKRTYEEKWVKPRGQVEEVFSGHDSEYFIDGVKTTKGNYDKAISELFGSIEIFKQLTLPKFVPAQDKKYLEELLSTIGGKYTIEDLKNDNPEYADIISELGKFSMDEYRVQLQQKIKLVKDQIAPIPIQIKERQNTIKPDSLYSNLEKDLETANSVINTINTKIADRKALLSNTDSNTIVKLDKIVEENNTLKEKSKLLSEKQKELSALKERLNNAAQTKYNDDNNGNIRINGEIATNNTRIATHQNDIETFTQTLKTTIKEKETLGNKYLELTAKVFTPTPVEEIICPVTNLRDTMNEECIHFFQKKELQDFNNKIAKEISEIISQGNVKKDYILKLQKDIKTKQDTINSILADTEEKKKKLVTLQQPKLIFTDNAQYVELSNQIALLEEEIQNNTPIEVAPEPIEDNSIDTETDTETETEVIPDAELQQLNETLEEAKQTLTELQDLQAEMKANQDNTKRINELTTELRTASQEQANLELKADRLAQLKILYNTKVEERANVYFSIVKWKFYEQQVNGGMADACNPTLNGVSFADVNRANKVNMGIDIINTLSKHYGLSIPILIDDAESINTILATDNQLIITKVTDDNSLVIN